MEEISLREILDLLQENWKMIVIITLVLVSFTAAGTILLIDKTYSSSTTLIVGKPEGYSSSISDTANELRINQQLVGTYSEIAKSKSVMTQVNSALNLGFSDGELADMITVSTVNNTELIKISVITEDPVLSATIANKTAEIFMTDVAELMKINNLQVVDEAVVNSGAVGPNLKLNLAIALLLGVIISVGIIFVKEALNTTVKTVDQLKNLAGDVSIIGVIPDCQELTLNGEK
jgi:capsular polysaccharide biosynthesis protein